MNRLKRISICLAIAAMAISAVVIGATRSTPPRNNSVPTDSVWAMNALWDDGLAEVATYDATREVYSESRSFEYTFITVKETFNTEYGVKTDTYDRQDLFDVMKVNMVCRIPTENYPYMYMTSLFSHRSSPQQLYKLTSSSQDWCGNTFKRVLKTDSAYVYSYDSYWDNEGLGERTYSADVVFEDQLMYSLRTLKFEKGLSFTLRVVPTMISPRATPAEVRNLTFVVSESSADTWKVEATHSGKPWAEWHYAKTYPNVLTEYRNANGATLRLTNVRRWAYWGG